MGFINAETMLSRVEVWLERIVIGQGLCPFAAEPRRQQRIGWYLSDARDDEALLADFQTVVDTLLKTDAQQLETSLLITPFLYAEFEQYQNALSMLELSLSLAGLDCTLQIASFHPDYCFADVPAADPANFTNRSPYPVFHLLREDSLSEALASVADPEAIPRRNIARFRKMTAATREELFQDLLPPAAKP